MKNGFSFPAYENPGVSLREYRVLYYSLDDSVEFRKDANGVWTLQDKVLWKVTFDGQNAIEVADGEKIPETAYPADPVKEGYEFIGWYNGTREWRATDRVSGSLNLVAKFKESEVKAEDKKKGGCGSVVNVASIVGILFVGTVLCLKRREN